MTGNRKYLNAAAGIANTLAANVQPGDADHSPWPFRVNAETNEVHQQEGARQNAGKTFTDSYTTNWSGALNLFDALISLKQGHTTDYAKAKATVGAWMKQYPLRTNKWGPFFEDIPTNAYSDTAINAGTFAMYILQHPDFDPNWKAQAKGILDWVYETFQNHEYDRWGVVPINEQTAYKVPGNSHTSRNASVELMYCAKTGDCATKEDAIRRLNWATYTVDTDGKNRYIRDDNWLTDGYGDYVRHFLRAMAAAPELASADQNHLLETTSVVQSIDYSGDAIRYRKFDRRSTERLKMGAWKPATVTGGTMQWDAAAKMLTVTSTAAEVTIRRAAD